MNDKEFQRAKASLAAATPEATLAWLEKQFGARAAIASSFGAEDVVLLHLKQQVAPSVRVFTLDTGRLPPETYELIEVLRTRLGIEVESYFPQATAVEQLTSTRGQFSFRESLAARRECCGIRKVEPLKRALATAEAWVTGMRREQAQTRDALEPVELVDGRLKLNPLATWTEAQTWAYVHEHALPYSRLHDLGYRSIGCAPCSRAVKPWEDARAGRWWWEQAGHKECGLHQ